MKYTPPRNDMKIRGIYCFLFMVAVIGLLIPHDGMVTTVIQCAAFLFLTASIFLLIKYELYTYTYILTERNNTLDFYINKSSGKRGSYVCYFPLTDAVYFERLEKGYGKTLRKTYENIGFYKYNKNIFTGEKYIIVFENGSKYDAVIFEPGKELVSAIQNEMSKIKENTEE